MIQGISTGGRESTEVKVEAVLGYKDRATAGFNALISSKLNQWTLLIGTLVVVYSIALGQYGTLPFDIEQTGEIWITAAQSYFALAVLVNFNISLREAVALFVLFISQVGLEFLFLRVWEPFPDPKLELLLVYTAIYLVLGTALFVRRRESLRLLIHYTANAARQALGREPTEPVREGECWASSSPGRTKPRSRSVTRFVTSSSRSLSKSPVPRPAGRPTVSPSASSRSAISVSSGRPRRSRPWTCSRSPPSTPGRPGGW
jgi:hypothetical protein